MKSLPNLGLTLTKVVCERLQWVGSKQPRQVRYQLQAPKANTLECPKFRSCKNQPSSSFFLAHQVAPNSRQAARAARRSAPRLHGGPIGQSSAHTQRCMKRKRWDATLIASSHLPCASGADSISAAGVFRPELRRGQCRWRCTCARTGPWGPDGPGDSPASRSSRRGSGSCAAPPARHPRPRSRV